MDEINDVSIVRKCIIIVFAFGLLAIGAVAYSAVMMQRIGRDYSAAMENQGNLAVYMPKANIALGKARRAIAELELARSDAGNAAATKDIQDGREDFVEVLAKAKAVSPDKAAVLDRILAGGLTLIDKTCAEAIRLGRATTEAEIVVAQSEYLRSCGPSFASEIVELKALGDAASAAQASVSLELDAATERTIVTTYVAMIASLVLVSAGAYFAINAWISRPIATLVDVMGRLARGDLSVDLSESKRKDEIGVMAKAIQVFKDNSLKLHQSETHRADVQREQQLVVAALAVGLDRLSRGDLTGRLDQAFAREYEKLRTDFNATADSLQQAVRTISHTTGSISAGSKEVAQAADDLAFRLEKQAASLEETAAALNMVTSGVTMTAAGALEAASVVSTTLDCAEMSGAVVVKAIDAMGRIKESSNQITQIIAVIDDIAAQTRMLSLNAAIEAAGAGSAGLGFAVVASEVRSLAARSAEAANEIKALILASTAEVEVGVGLVGRTGAALEDIIQKVAKMDRLVRDISATSRDQAAGLTEINIAVSQMDQVVQQNAAIVEESATASHALQSETQYLMTMVGRFMVGEPSERDARARAATAPPTPASRAEAFAQLADATAW